MDTEPAWQDYLPAHLKATAYEAHDEWAWRRGDAIEVLEFLRETEYVVLGVDIWLATQPGPTIPTPFVYDWSLESERPREDASQSAVDFVRKFAWDPADKSHRGMEPYFNICVMRRDG